MKNPIIALAGVVVLSISLPIFISVVSYGDKEEVKIEKNITVSNESKDKQSKKIVSYETIDKESPKIKVYNHILGKTQDMDMEEYLCGVLSGEMSPSFELEALKAQAVAARTFVIYKQEQGNPSKHSDAPVCTNYEHCQEYKSAEQLEKTNGEKWMKESYSKIQQAVRETKGQIITYDKKAIQPLYFSTSSGKTENSEEVFSAQYPYLKSVESKYDTISPKFESEVKVSREEFANYINKSYSGAGLTASNLDNQVKIIDRSNGGATNNIKIGNKELTGRDIRRIFKLNSANFDINFDDKDAIFKVKGYGHGVGMSQWGAEGMAQEGYKYYDILLHYYTGTEIKDIY